MAITPVKSIYFSDPGDAPKLLRIVGNQEKFNDTFGHEAGDVLLRELATRLQRGVRDSDVVCRFGGEEFLLLLPGTTLEVAMARMERLREDIAQLSLVHNGQTLGKVTASIGVAAYPGHGTNSDELIAAADAALYRAKKAGRDRVVAAGAADN